MPTTENKATMSAEDIVNLFEANSKKAMAQSEEAISQRSWVKSERKETEAETWQEAARILKNKLSKPPIEPIKSAKDIKNQYITEHPERVGETDREFALINYIEWLETKMLAQMKKQINKVR